MRITSKKSGFLEVFFTLSVLDFPLKNVFYLPAETTAAEPSRAASKSTKQRDKEIYRVLSLQCECKVMRDWVLKTNTKDNK